MHDCSEQRRAALFHVTRARLDLDFEKMVVLPPDDCVDPKVVDKGHVDIQSLAQHLADEPIFHAAAKAGRMSECDRHGAPKQVLVM
jgi:hypothetical protein